MFQRQWQRDLYNMITGDDTPHLIVSVIGVSRQEKSEFLHSMSRNEETLPLISESWGSTDFWSMTDRISKSRVNIVIIDASICIGYQMNIFHMEEIIKVMRTSKCDLFVMFNDTVPCSQLPNYIGVYAVTTADGLTLLPSDICV
jgi:hypothetical protein